MLFWLFIIILVVGVACIIIGNEMYNHTKYDTEWLFGVGLTITILFSLVVCISVIAMACSHVGVDAQVAENHERYKSLTYQLKNDLYNNDNDVGKKELYDQIREWNEDLAYHQNIQDDFWLGIFHPDIYDQFEFIDYGGEEQANERE